MGQSILAGRVSRQALILTALIAVAGCSKQPGGQVAAVVNGEEVTQQELRAEADTAGVRVPQGPLPPEVATQMLERVINRNLLAEYAREQGLDRGPEYVLRRRQLEQTLLANLATRKVLGTPTKPTERQVQEFITKNPTLFAQRQRLTLDQLRFPTPADPKRIQQLAQLGSIDAIARQLAADNVTAQRSSPALDTATIDPAVANQIVALPPGEIFDISTGGTTFINVITGRANVATPPATWTAPATEAVRRTGVGNKISDTIEKLRKEAKIAYDSAYQPKAKK
jgi:EpsD family peptidyl-prolyl cis-trans isomerase